MKNLQNRKNIIKVGRQLCGFSLICRISSAIGLIIFLLETAITLTHGGNSRAIYLTWSGTMEAAMAIMITLNFFRFFDRLKNGELFDAKTIGHLEAAGKWWLGSSVANIFFALAGRWLGASMGFDFGQVFASLTIIFVAWLLLEAHELQEDQVLTV